MYTHLAKGFATASQESLMVINRRKLNSCLQHFFEPFKAVKGQPPALLKCLSCDGYLPFEQAAEYAKGFAAAGGDPETVIEGFGR